VKQYSFLYYSSPDITKISPRYGPVKASQTAEISGKNFECPDTACSKLKVKFETDEGGIVVPGTLVSSSKISIKVPAYTKPDVLPIAITFNGYDYTKSTLTYGYFDPFIIEVLPKLVPSDRKSKFTIKGFGFIDPDNKDDLKVKLTSAKGDLICAGKPCIVPAQYVDKHTVTCASQMMSTLQYADGSKVGLNEPIWVEMTLMGVHFTD
jgi:hypothetical protein